MRYKLRPVSLKEAQDFTDKYHRHNAAPQGHKFSIGLEKDGELVGVCTVGRPVARCLDDGYTAEITRLCINPEISHNNANSMLYGAAVRAAKSMGYTSVITYTLVSESGASLKAAGFTEQCKLEKRSGWDTKSRRRNTEKYPSEEKIRWIHT